MGKLTHLKYKLLEHPHFSPDLAPTDGHQFTILITIWAGKLFGSNVDVTALADGYFADSHIKDDRYPFIGVTLDKIHWVKGDYTKNIFMF